MGLPVVAISSSRLMKLVVSLSTGMVFIFNYELGITNYEWEVCTRDFGYGLGVIIFYQFTILQFVIDNS